jgi:hypothetical protein
MEQVAKVWLLTKTLTFKEQLSMAMPVIRQAAVDANNEFNARRGRGGIR